MPTKGIWTTVIILLFSLSLSSQAAPPLPGAIFTTDENGSLVNGNIYDAKCAVYLDGGPPPNAPTQAASLPDGWYYFQVTNPSGSELLSTDPIDNRMFEVSGGVIVGTGMAGHPTSADIDGGVVVQLCPYLDTPNNGGVYKVWVTPEDDYVAAEDCGRGCFHGFVPNSSKTDNFKVRVNGGEEPTFCLNVYKEIAEEKKKDTNFLPGANWEITLSGPVSGTYYTDSTGFLEVCNLTAGTYTVTEALSSGGIDYVVIWTELNGNVIEPPTETVQLNWSAGDPSPQVIYFINEEMPCKKDCKK